MTAWAYSVVSPAAADYVLGQTVAGATSRYTAQALRDGGSVYGHMYYSNDGAGSGLVMATASTYYGFLAMTAGTARGVTIDVADATADHITVTQAGTYKISFTSACTPSAAGTYIYGLAVNGTMCACGGTTRTTPTTTDEASGDGMTIVQLAAGAEVSFRATCTTSNTRTLTFHRVSVIVERVGS